MLSETIMAGRPNHMDHAVTAGIVPREFTSVLTLC